MSGKGVQSGGESSVKAVVKPTRCPHRGKKGHLHRPFLAPTLWEVATRASQRNRRKMEDRWATATRQGASRHADALVCVTAGSTTTLPARTGSTSTTRSWARRPAARCTRSATRRWVTRRRLRRSRPSGQDVSPPSGSGGRRRSARSRARGRRRLCPVQEAQTGRLAQEAVCAGDAARGGARGCPPARRPGAAEDRLHRCPARAAAAAACPRAASTSDFRGHRRLARAGESGSCTRARVEPEERRLAELEALLSHDEFEPVPGRKELWRELMDLTRPSWDSTRQLRAKHQTPLAMPADIV